MTDDEIQAQLDKSFDSSQMRATIVALSADLLETRKAARTLAMMIAHQDMNRAGMALLAKWIKDAIDHGFDPSEIGL